MSGDALSGPELDQLDLLSALTDYAQALVLGEVARATVLRLARRLVQDPRLTDEEVVRLAGRRALDTLRSSLEAPSPEQSQEKTP